MKRQQASDPAPRTFRRLTESEQNNVEPGITRDSDGRPFSIQQLDDMAESRKVDPDIRLKIALERAKHDYRVNKARKRDKRDPLIKEAEKKANRDADERAAQERIDRDFRRREAQKRSREKKSSFSELYAQEMERLDGQAVEEDEDLSEAETERLRAAHRQRPRRDAWGAERHATENTLWLADFRKSDIDRKRHSL